MELQCARQTLFYVPNFYPTRAQARPRSTHIFAAGDAMSEAKNSKANPPERARPKRQRRSRRKDGLNIPARIDDFFNTRISVKEGETSRYVTCFQTILHQLWLQATAGSRKAGKLFVRYMNFAASQGSPAGFDIRIIPDPPEDQQDK
jgi:hypothetical protein